MRPWLYLVFVARMLPGAAVDLSALPVFFEPSAVPGGPAGFISRTPQFDLLITGEAAVIGLANSDCLTMRVVNASAKSLLTAESRLPGQSSYLLGRDPAKWRSGIPHYARVRVANVLPKIDLIYYGTAATLEYDFILHPGADATRIALHFEGMAVRTVSASGNLEIATKMGKVVQHKPHVLQDGHAVEGAYLLQDNGDVRIVLGTYDHARELVIDPVITYSTYLGGAVYDSPNAIAVDSAGNTYIAGSTSSFNFPVTIGAPYTAFPPTRVMVAFVAKLNAAGTALIYATYLGGSGVNGGDAANGIAVDSSGSAYVTGTTGSADFPVTAGSLSSSLNGPVDAFVTKLNPAGTGLIYSTYFGGSGVESAAAIAIDVAGDAFITGSTGSTDFPVTAGALQTALKSADDAFIAKLNPAGKTLIYATYLGGSQADNANALAVDTAGNAYIAGSTASPDFPVTSSYQTTLTGSAAAFAAKINPAGTALVYSTFLGGSGGDYASAIAVDGLGATYIAGTTFSGDFPVTPGSYAATVPGASGLGHGFVSKLSTNGASLIYSTFLGGSNSDAVTGLALDPAGNAILTGFTYSTNFPVSANSLDVVKAYSPAGFVSKLSAAGGSLLYSSLLGAAGSTAAQALALDTTNHLFVTGYTASQNFPATAGAFQPADSSISGRTGIGFVLKIDLGSPTVCLLSVSTPSLPVPLTGGSVSASVTAPAGCAWEAVFASSWLTGASVTHGVGPGSVTFLAASNQASLSARSTVVSIGGVALTVTQPGGSCAAPQMFPPTQTFGAAGGAGSVAIVLPSSCAFTAASSAGWLVITGGAGGTGNSLLEFTVAADSGVSRVGTLTIAGKPYTVSQLTNVCGYSVRFPSGAIAPSSGGNLLANLTTSGDCAWTASSNSAWLVVTSPRFVGSGPIFLQAKANNTGYSRKASVIIAGQTYIVWQYANGT